MLVQLNKCVVVSGSDLQRGHSGDRCCLRRFCLSMRHLFVLSWVRVQRVARYGGVLFRSDVLSGMVFVTLLCCRLLRYVQTMLA